MYKQISTWNPDKQLPLASFPERAWEQDYPPCAQIPPLKTSWKEGYVRAGHETNYGPENQACAVDTPNVLAVLWLTPSLLWLTPSLLASFWSRNPTSTQLVLYKVLNTQTCNRDWRVYLATQVSLLIALIHCYIVQAYIAIRYQCNHSPTTTLTTVWCHPPYSHHHLTVHSILLLPAVLHLMQCITILHTGMF